MQLHYKEELNIIHEDMKQQGCESVYRTNTESFKVLKNQNTNSFSFIYRH